MRIIDARTYTGANIYAPHSVTALALDFTSGRPGPRLTGSRAKVDALLGVTSALAAQRCGPRSSEVWLEDFAAGGEIAAAHLVEHLALAFLAEVGLPASRALGCRAAREAWAVFGHPRGGGGAAVVAGRVGVTVLRALVGPLDQDEPALDVQLSALRVLTASLALDADSAALAEAAEGLDLPWVRRGRRLLAVGQGARQRRTWGAHTDLSSAVGARVAAHRSAVSRLLDGAGLPTPRGFTVRSEAAALKAARRVGGALLVRPDAGSGLDGVSRAVEGEAALRLAFTAARRLAAAVRVERSPVGERYRLLVVGGRTVAVHRLGWVPGEPPALLPDEPDAGYGALAARVAAVVGLEPLAVEVVTPDLSRPPALADALILDVVARPSLDLKTAPAVLRDLFPQGAEAARVPTVLVCGGLPERGDLVGRWILHLLWCSGQRAGRADEASVEVGGAVRTVAADDLTDPALALLDEPRLTCGVVGRGAPMVMGRGLGLDRTTVSVITDLAEGGEAARVALSVAQAGVLSVQDFEALGGAATLGWEVPWTLVGGDAEASAVRAQAQGGGRGACLEGAELCLLDGESELRAGGLGLQPEELPAALLTAGAGLALGVPAEEVVTAIRSRRLAGTLPVEAWRAMAGRRLLLLPSLLPSERASLVEWLSGRGGTGRVLIALAGPGAGEHAAAFRDQAQALFVDAPEAAVGRGVRARGSAQAAFAAAMARSRVGDRVLYVGPTPSARAVELTQMGLSSPRPAPSPRAESAAAMVAFWGDTSPLDHSLDGLGSALADADVCLASPPTPLPDPEDFAAALAARGGAAADLAQPALTALDAPDFEAWLRALEGRGLRWVGAGRSAREAASPLTHVVRVGAGRARIVVFAGLEVGAEGEGYARARVGGVLRWSVGKLKRQIAALRESYDDLLVVARPRWAGARSGERRRRRAVELMDAGVDLILASGDASLGALWGRGGRWALDGLGRLEASSEPTLAASLAVRRGPDGWTLRLSFALCHREGVRAATPDEVGPWVARLFPEGAPPAALHVAAGRVLLSLPLRGGA